jgi:hypothetical protein
MKGKSHFKIACTLIFLILFVASHLMDQNALPEEEWVARYDGLDANLRRDEASGLAVDSSGNVYVTGVSYRKSTGGDYATVAYDTHGNKLWEARYSNPAANNTDWAKAIAVGPSGNVYVTGFSFDNETLHDYATVAYDSSNGDQLWAARYDGPAENGLDLADAIAVGSSGNVYVTGRSMTVNRNAGNNRDYDIATVAYDNNGNQLWEARYNGSFDTFDWGIAIATDPSGNVYVTGHLNYCGTGAGDWITIAYDSSGNQLWQQIYEGYMGMSASPTAMVVDAAGNVYVTGYTTNRRNPTWGYMYVTIAYDSSGTRKWIAEYDQENNESGRDIALDSMGNVYVTGYSADDYATIAYDSNGNQLWEARYPNGGWNGLPGYPRQYDCAIAVDSSGIVYVTGGSYSSESNGDYVTIAYDTNGNQIWEATYNGPGNDYDRSVAIAIDPANNVYVTGYSTGDGTGNDYCTIKYGRSLTISVDIDIKPGGFPNSINPRSKGVIPVAILTTDTFDATTVDGTTVRFGPDEAEPAHYTLEDVDWDGDLDMIFHFRTQETGIECGDNEVALSGETVDGQQITGKDSIKTVGCK